MIASKEAQAEAMKYSPNREDLRDAFIAGVQWAQNGKYYKPVDLFVDIDVPSFEDWWNAYDKKCGRKKSEAKWNKLSPSQKVACMEATPAYVNTTSDKKFRKDPLTYLNGECWNDELIYKQDNDQQRAQYFAKKAANILNAE